MTRLDNSKWGLGTRRERDVGERSYRVTSLAEMLIHIRRTILVKALHGHVDDYRTENLVLLSANLGPVR